jgi:integrase
MPRLGCRAGLAKRVHFHGLRHAHAQELARENAYLNRIAPQEVIDTIQARAWTL